MCFILTKKTQNFRKNRVVGKFCEFPHCDTVPYMWKNEESKLTRKKISLNQLLFSNFLSKTFTFTEFCQESVRVNFHNSAVEITKIYSHSFDKKLRESNVFTTELISRKKNFGEREFAFFHSTMWFEKYGIILPPFFHRTFVKTCMHFVNWFHEIFSSDRFLVWEIHSRSYHFAQNFSVKSTQLVLNYINKFLVFHTALEKNPYVLLFWFVCLKTLYIGIHTLHTNC